MKAIWSQENYGVSTSGIMWAVLLTEPYKGCKDFIYYSFTLDLICFQSGLEAGKKKLENKHIREKREKKKNINQLAKHTSLKNRGKSEGGWRL